MIHFNTRYSNLLALTFALAFIAGCGDDDPTGGGTADTTAPSVSSVTAVDGGHVDITFNENVQRGSAETPGNYVIVETAVPLVETSGSAPGDTLVIYSASLGSDQRTVSLTTQLMSDAPYELGVTGVRDASGNTIETPVVRSFTGSTAPDTTPPQLVYRSPAPDATGVAVGAQILLTFSEPVTLPSFMSGFTLSMSVVTVPVTANSLDGVHVVVTPNSLLELNTDYIVSLVDIEDLSANVMPDVSWTFRTSNVEDTTPPTLVSSIPANNALNVDVNTVLSLTFSEAIDQTELGAILSPDPGDGELVWSNGGKTLTFTPDVPLLDDQQYTLTILPGGFRDLVGNLNTQYTQIRFSTGAYFATGSFAGTLSGDPESDFADDPTGARVLAAVAPFVGLDDLEVAGSAVVAGNNTFNVTSLADNVYGAIAIMDINNDHVFDPSMGDPIGGYGVDFLLGDMEPDSITVTGGNHVTGIDFRLFDFSAIMGTVSYSGVVSGSHFVGIGLFNVVGFDYTNPPDFTTEGSWPDFPEWGFLNFADEIPDGSYYVGAFLDANDNFALDLGSDPIGFYGGLPSPTPLTIDNGSDVHDIVIPITDPPAARASGSVAWRGPAKRAMPEWLKNLSVKAPRDVTSGGFVGASAVRGRNIATTAPNAGGNRSR